MSGFRKTSYPILIAMPHPIVEVQLQTYEEKVGDEVITRVAHVPVDLCSPEASSTLPTYKEYYLEELLKAGVPLDVINVSGMLNVSDPENLKNLRLNALSSIQDKIVNSNVD